MSKLSFTPRANSLCRRGIYAEARLGVSDLPRQKPQPTFDVTGGADQLVLQVELFAPAISRPAQSVTSHQFTMGAFDAVALMHAFLERGCFLLAPPLLQNAVILSGHQSAMSLPCAHTALPQSAIMTMATPFKTIIHLSTFLLLKTAALRALFLDRTKRSPFFNPHVEILRAKALWMVHTCASWTKKFPPLDFGFGQALG